MVHRALLASLDRPDSAKPHVRLVQDLLSRVAQRQFHPRIRRQGFDRREPESPRAAAAEPRHLAGGGKEEARPGVFVEAGHGTGDAEGGQWAVARVEDRGRHRGDAVDELVDLPGVALRRG